VLLLFRARTPGRYGLLLLLSLLVVTGAGARARQAQEPVAGERAGVQVAGLRGFYYVTEADRRPAEALSSCAAGYHMASLWEILDPTELRYARCLAEAKVLADQGSGPPAGYWGWVRTGGDGSVVELAGQANCHVWTDTALGHFGTIVRLNPDWAAPASAISPWEARTWGCQQIAPVWCVSDGVYGVWLPMVGR
jgi:hypothetical protein